MLSAIKDESVNFSNNTLVNLGIFHCIFLLGFWICFVSTGLKLSLISVNVGLHVWSPSKQLAINKADH